LSNDASGPEPASSAPFNSRKVKLPKTRPAGSEKRRSARIPVRKSVQISWQKNGSEQVADAFTFSISRNGCGLYSEMFLLPGAGLKLSISRRSISGRVVHTLKDHSTNLVTMGVAFDEDASDFWQVGFDFLTPTSLP
jgi:PilZ domain